jgi:hypothetical protein
MSIPYPRQAIKLVGVRYSKNAFRLAIAQNSGAFSRNCAHEIAGNHRSFNIAFVISLSETKKDFIDDKTVSSFVAAESDRRGIVRTSLRLDD